MNRISYATAHNGIDIQVKVNGKVAGHIRRGHWGYLYVPVGGKMIMSEASFSLEVIKKQLEG